MKCHEAVVKYGSEVKAAAGLGLSRSTFRSRLAAEKLQAFKGDITPPEIPSPDLPIDEVITLCTRQFEAMHKSREAEEWCAFEVHDPLPIGILWFGDPHLGDTGCNWPLLQQHVELCRNTPGLYGANIGDVTNNWPTGGRLAKKWADQDTSMRTEQRLARWFLADSGVRWLLWIMGNHDAWNQGSTILRSMNINGVLMQDWEAKFALRFPNSREVRIHAAHDFKGSSIWNIMHGAVRAATISSDADLYVCGHRHDWGISQFELAGRHRTPTLIRTRGYKWHDEYARVHGFQSSQSGSAILTILNVNAPDPAGRVMAFSDVEAGAAVLATLRRSVSQAQRRTDRATSKPSKGSARRPGKPRRHEPGRKAKHSPASSKRASVQAPVRSDQGTRQRREQTTRKSA